MLNDVISSAISLISGTKYVLESRPIQDSDKPFLEELYRTTRAAELAQVAWTETQVSEFIAMQFNAQHTFYMEQFKNAEFGVVSKDGLDIGRLYIDERDSEIRIIDIALLPNYQKMGIGKGLLEAVQEQAAAKNLPITIHVEKNNPAMRLYELLGFQMVEDQGVYDLMKWQASSQN